MTPPEDSTQPASGLTDEQWREIDEFIRKGMKISAIKFYREYTGEGLRESKDAVEEREKTL